MTTLASRRRRVEREFTDSVTVAYKDPSGAMTQDPDTGSETPAYLPRLTGAKARFKSDDVQPVTQEVGGRTATAARTTMEMAALTTPIPQVGDKVTIDAVGPKSNPARVGMEYEVTGEPIGTDETRLRIPVRRWAS